jgi:hypothetical protein
MSNSSFAEKTSYAVVKEMVEYNSYTTYSWQTIIFNNYITILKKSGFPNGN